MLNERFRQRQDERIAMAIVAPAKVKNQPLLTKTNILGETTL
jgi:hypothetical protein